MKVIIPIKTVSETNQREHWRTRHRRRKAQRVLARYELAAFPRPVLPVVVGLVRISPRKLDDDNLRGALKAIRDGVADWIGLDDADPRIEWRYDQRRGKPKQRAVEISVDVVHAEI